MMRLPWGECLVDFMIRKSLLTNTDVLEGNPGGAPANVMAGLARLGMRTAFIGMVGDDPFGNFLRGCVMDANVDTSGMVLSKEYDTTLAFVTLDEKNDRSFSFLRN